VRHLDRTNGLDMLMDPRLGCGEIDLVHRASSVGGVDASKGSIAIVG